MKKLSFLLAVILLAGSVVAQTGTITKKAICGKKWHGIKYTDEGGKSHTIPAEEVNSYIVYECNGQFTSVENGNTIKGTWVLDTKNRAITTTQTQTAPSPVRIVKQVVTADKDNLVIRAKEADGSYRTVYFETMH